MAIIVLDTALNRCSVAISDKGGGIMASISRQMTKGHAEAIVPMIAQAFEKAKISPKALTKVAVTIGPGSFTGLRTAIAAARAIALVDGIPCVGISSLRALALSTGVTSRSILAVIDARHSRAYSQFFPNQKASPADIDRINLLEPGIMNYADIIDCWPFWANQAVIIVGSGSGLVIAGLKQITDTGANSNALSTRIIVGGEDIDIELLAKAVIGLEPQSHPAKPFYVTGSI